MTYLAQVVRPSMCCKSTHVMGLVVKVETLVPACSDNPWICSACFRQVPDGEIMAMIGSGRAIQKYRLASLPSPEAVQQYDQAPVTT